MKTSRIAAMVASAVCFVGLSFAAHANPTYITFDVPGAVDTYPVAIAGNRIAGSWYDGTTYHGFVRHANGQFETFDVAGATATRATCINISGEVAGVWVDGGSVSHGFTRSPDGSTITPFDVPGGSGAVAVTGINSTGTVVGDDILTEFFLRDSLGNLTTFSGGNGSLRIAGTINDAGYMVGTLESVGTLTTAKGLLRDPLGTITDVVVPGDSFTFASAIDQNGKIGGSYSFPNLNLGFIMKPNTTFDTFAHPAASIDGGVVTGSFLNAQGHERGFIHALNGGITNVHVTGSMNTYALSIWNGKVTGNYTDSSGISHGYLRTP